MQHHPAVARGDALGAADVPGVLAEHLALEEDAPGRGRQATEALLEDLPEAPLLERRLGVAPRLRRAAPMARLVELLVDPVLVLVGRRLLAHVLACALGDGAPLQVGDLEAQDRGEPGAQRRLAAKAGDAFQRRKQAFL